MTAVPPCQGELISVLECLYTLKALTFKIVPSEIQEGDCFNAISFFLRSGALFTFKCLGKCAHTHRLLTLAMAKVRVWLNVTHLQCCSKSSFFKNQCKKKQKKKTKSIMGMFHLSILTICVAPQKWGTKADTVIENSSSSKRVCCVCDF